MTPQLKILLQKISHHSLFKNNDFTLIGGTALSFHLGHRISEDLDFIISNILPQEEIKNLLQELKDDGSQIIFKPQPDKVLYEYEEACENIHEDHQDWIVDGVKLTFVNSKAMGDSQEIISSDIPTIFNGIKIASIDTIFKMKSLLIMDRTKSRDYFDLLTLYKTVNSAHTPTETIKLIQKHHPFYGYDLNFLKNYIQNVDCGLNDESLDGLLNNNKNITFDELKADLLNELLPEIDNIIFSQELNKQIRGNAKIIPVPSEIENMSDEERESAVKGLADDSDRELNLK